MTYKDRKSYNLKITIFKLIDKTCRKVEIRDSYAILSNGLKTLSNKYDFEKDKRKGVFPHEFSNISTLFYVGNTPDYKYYEDIDFDTYKTICKTDWSFKVESLLYLEKDLYSLYEELKKANHKFFVLFNKVQMTNCLTISRLALEIFMKHYYTEANISLIKNKNIYR